MTRSTTRSEAPTSPASTAARSAPSVTPVAVSPNTPAVRASSAMCSDSRKGAPAAIGIATTYGAHQPSCSASPKPIASSGCAVAKTRQERESAAVGVVLGPSASLDVERDGSRVRARPHDGEPGAGHSYADTVTAPSDAEATSVA